MSLSSTRFKNIISPLYIDIIQYGIIGFGSSFVLGLGINDIFCFHFLKKNQYKYLNYYYKAKYTYMFLYSAGITGMIIGGLYGHTKKPLFFYLLKY